MKTAMFRRLQLSGNFIMFQKQLQKWTGSANFCSKMLLGINNKKDQQIHAIKQILKACVCSLLLSQMSKTPHFKNDHRQVPYSVYTAHKYMSTARGS